MEASDTYGTIEFAEEWSFRESKDTKAKNSPFREYSKEDVIGSPRKSFDISSTSIEYAKRLSSDQIPRPLFTSKKSKSRKKKLRSQAKRRNLYASWVESRPWGIFITVVTLYALFGDDFRLLAFAKDADNVFYILSFLALLIFSLEIVVSVYARKGYLWGFIFWQFIIQRIHITKELLTRTIGGVKLQRLR